MSPTDKVRELGGKVASGAKKGVSKGRETIDNVVLKPDPEYSGTIDLHRRVAYVLTGLPIYALAEKVSFHIEQEGYILGDVLFSTPEIIVNGMSDSHSFLYRTADTIGNLLITGMILRQRREKQERAAKKGEDGALNRATIDMTVAAMWGMGFGLVSYAIGEPLVQELQEWFYGEDNTSSMLTVGQAVRTAGISGGLAAILAPARFLAADIVNLSYGREPKGKLYPFIDNKSSTFYKGVQIIGGTALSLATAAAYVAF